MVLIASDAVPLTPAVWVYDDLNDFAETLGPNVIAQRRAWLVAARIRAWKKQRLDRFARMRNRPPLDVSGGKCDSLPGSV